MKPLGKYVGGAAAGSNSYTVGWGARVWAWGGGYQLEGCKGGKEGLYCHAPKRTYIGGASAGSKGRLVAWDRGGDGGDWEMCSGAAVAGISIHVLDWSREGNFFGRVIWRVAQPGHQVF